MLISIITINFNNLNGLKKTMQSVLRQTYNGIEYIIIDGDSSDGSKEVIKQSESIINYWVSESDNGIYHAMNKGIDKAHGDYLLFLNSGDYLADDNVVDTFVNLKPKEDIVYGDSLVREKGKWRRKHMPKKLTVGTLLTHTLSHQAQFYSKNVFNDNYRYDTSYRVISDWIFTNNAIIFQNCTSKYLDVVVCYFDDPGVSSDVNLRQKERRRYLKEHFDPLFLDLLKDYKTLNNRHKNLNNSALIKPSLWLLKLKSRLSIFFKN